MSFTDMLFARPTLREGIGRVLDIGGFMSEPNQAQSPEEADSLAHACDWSATLSDLNYAGRLEMIALEEELNRLQPSLPLA